MSAPIYREPLPHNRKPKKKHVNKYPSQAPNVLRAFYSCYRKHGYSSPFKAMAHANRLSVLAKVYFCELSSEFHITKAK